MWLLYILSYSFFEGLVNYFDEYLTINNPSRKESSSIYEETGGLIIISTLFTFLGIIGLGTYLGASVLDINQGAYIAFFSAVPMVILWIGYFFMFTKYPAHHVVPLLGLASIWLVATEWILGASVTFISLVGIAVLLFGSYLLDVGDLKTRVSTGLLVRMIPLSVVWAITLFMVQLASQHTGASYVYFYQLIGIFLLGVILFTVVTPFRNGFLTRIREQRKKFLGMSVGVELAAQCAYLSITFATAAAPLVAYVAATGGLKSILLLGLLFLFPIHERNKITAWQLVAIVLVVLGVFIIEFWR